MSTILSRNTKYPKSFLKCKKLTYANLSATQHATGNCPEITGNPLTSRQATAKTDEGVEYKGSRKTSNLHIFLLLNPKKHSYHTHLENFSSVVKLIFKDPQQEFLAITSDNAAIPSWPVRTKEASSSQWIDILGEGSLNFENPILCKACVLLPSIR